MLCCLSNPKHMLQGLGDSVSSRPRCSEYPGPPSETPTTFLFFRDFLHLPIFPLCQGGQCCMCMTFFYSRAGSSSMLPENTICRLFSELRPSDLEISSRTPKTLPVN